MRFINLEPVELILIVIVALAVGAFMGKFATEKNLVLRNKNIEEGLDKDGFINYDDYCNTWFDA